MFPLSLQSADTSSLLDWAQVDSVAAVAAWAAGGVGAAAVFSVVGLLQAEQILEASLGFLRAVVFTGETLSRGRHGSSSFTFARLGRFGPEVDSRDLEVLYLFGSEFHHSIDRVKEVLIRLLSEWTLLEELI